MAVIAAPAGIVARESFGEVAGTDEVHEHRVELGEGRTGESGAAEEVVDRSIDRRDDIIDRGAVAQVDLGEVVDGDHGRLDVDRGDARAEVDEDLRGCRAHSRRGSSDDH